MRSIGRPPAVDAAIAAALAGLAIAEAVASDAPVVWLVGAPLAMVPLAWRRLQPVPAIGLALLLFTVAGTLGAEGNDSVLPLPLMVLSAYTAGREAPTRRAALLGAAAIALWVAVGLNFGVAENSGAEDLLALLVLLGAPAAAGRALHNRHAEARDLQSLTETLAAERDRRAQAAVAEERARVARELHDVVAHGISLIAVQAAAADELLGRDEDRAREALRAVQDTARDALGEMRRLLTVLRTDGDEPGLAPHPGLGAIHQLVDQARAGGLPVQLHEEGTREKLPAGIDLAAYRIVQEALTNVRKHAGEAATDIVVRYRPDAVEIEVANVHRPTDGTASAHPGYGITGMKERARLHGGTLTTGQEDGRFVLRACLPLAAVLA